MSTPLAELVRRMSADGCSAETIAAAIEAAEMHAQMYRPVVDESAERRRMRDAARKRETRGVGRQSAEPEKGAVVEANIPPVITHPTDATSQPPKPPSSPRGTRIPADFQARQAERDVALSLGWSEVEIDDELERFRDYWLARAGKEARKVDWDRTFRNRVKDLNDRRKRAPPPRNGNGAETSWERQNRAFQDRIDECDQGQDEADFAGTAGSIPRLSGPGADRH